MNKNQTTLFAEIFKVDKKQKMVYGYASTGARDSQGEIILPDAMIKAMPDYMKFGNIREMHGRIAAGVVKEHNFTDTGTYIGAKIVDPLAWEKVIEGVYKGFSIGGKVTERDAKDDTIISGIELTEISLVDRPANPGALFDVIKAYSPRVDVIEDDELAKVDEEDDTPEGTEIEPIPAPAIMSDPPSTATEAQPVPTTSPPSTDGVGGTSIGTKVVDESLNVAFVGKIFEHYGINTTKVAEEVLGVPVNSPPLVEAVLKTLDFVAKVRLSGANRDAAQAIHDHASNMGAQCDSDGDEDDKVQVLKPGDFAKAVEKVTELEKTITERDETIKSLNITIDELKAKPQAKQPALKVVNKGDDFTSDNNDDTDEEALKKMTPMERSLFEIRKSHMAPLTRI